jgi:NAD(P)-dependent dehydrogenase (short-subunit alcohol dehydrogenase family)
MSAGKRIVVVGASSGLGRCMATHLGKNGAQVALMARRHDRLVDAAKEAGNGALAIACDVTDADSVAAAFKEAVDGLGGIDTVIYSTGIGDLAKLTKLDADTLNRTFATNVTGAHLVTQAALPHLKESKGNQIYLSSVIGSVTDPWPGLAAYSVTKAALERLIEAWRIEHPDVGLTRLTVGDCAGGEGVNQTEFNAHWDMTDIGELATIWINRNYIAGVQFDVVELLRTVDMLVGLGASANIPTIVIQPRQPQLVS